MTSTTIYYTYAYLRSVDSETAKAGTPYYIGKGRGNRAYDKHSVPIPKDKSRIIFLEQNLTELGALALERRYIRWYGRKDLGTGILLNRTDGGDGGPGTVSSEEKRLKSSKANLGKITSEETKKKMSEAHLGKQFSEEHRRNMSEAKKGKPGYIRTNESKEKQRIAMSGKTQRKVECPHCGKVGGVSVMNRHHFNNCKFSVSL
jgi:hypothetical protein